MRREGAMQPTGSIRNYRATIDSIGMWGVLATLDDKNGSLRGYNRPMVYSISGQDTLFFGR